MYRIGPFAWLLVGLAISPLAGLAEAEEMLPTTAPPIIYVINYSGDYFKNPDYIEQFRASPPDLLHVGKATPITHLWGPVRMYQGENQYTGGPGHTLNWDNISLISPQALTKRIETIRRTLRRYHEIGISEITPYISYHTLAGDHEKRQGFWNFYDNWETYREWAGERPPRDPFGWLVVDAAGKFVGGSSGGYSPEYYAPLHRYRACINHPDWAQWHRRLIRMIADVGYNGCFVDNCHPDRCYCRYCKAVFRQFLEENRDLHWVRRLTEGLDVKKLELDSPTAPAELVRRARLLRTRDHLAMLRGEGRRVDPNFTIFPNGNSVSECLVTGGKCDRLMFESTYSPGMMATRNTVTIDEIAIDVAGEPVEAKSFTHRYDVGDSANWMEMEAEIAVPAKVQVGQPVPLTIRVISVGGSQSDNDFAEQFYFLLREASSGEEIRIDLTPRLVLGAPGPAGDGVRPPAELSTTWTPQRPGKYLPHFGFKYTDAGHIQAHSHLARLDRGRICRTHLGTLLFAQNMRARSIFLSYEARREGQENVAELGMAEMAAFSGGGGFAAGGPVLAKYRGFFKKHADLFDGWKQTAPAAVLFAYWGGNPLAHVRPVGQAAIHDHLAETQRLFVSLIDAYLPDDAQKLEDFRAVYLQARQYDMTQGQISALLDYVRRGGWLVILDKQVAINGGAAAKRFGIGDHQTVRQYGDGKIVLWSWQHPTTPTSRLVQAEGADKNIRFALYRKDSRLALHAVNYNVCLLDDDKPVLDVDGVQIELALPEGWTGVTAACFDPDVERQALDCVAEDRRVRFSLPRIHLYKIVTLERREP